MKHAKNLKVFIIVLFLSLRCLGNKIDLINSDTAMFHFIMETFREYRNKAIYFQHYDSATIKTADSLTARNWYKIDIDGNGETDLAIFNSNLSSNVFIVLSINGKYKKATAIKEINFHFLYPVLKIIQGEPVYFLYHQMNDLYDELTKQFTHTPLEADTLICHKGFILNYLAKPKNLQRRKN